MNHFNYLVTYQLGKHERTDCFEAADPGAAFAVCLQKFPEARLIRASCNAYLDRRKIGSITYDPPPVQRLPVKVRMGSRKPRRNDPEGKLSL